MTTPLSKNETIKRESVYLKGKILEDLADSTRGGVTEESYELLKFHGSYEQFNRDEVERRKKEAAAKGERANEEKPWSFMVRLKIAGGQLRAEQYLALDAIAEKYAGSTLRITTRETFQIHGVVKKDLKPTIAEINHALLTTVGGCGDVVRNVLCCPAPFSDAKHLRMRADANAISTFTLPKTSAYHEIWVDGENLAREVENETYEPLYGRTYLPRKFKIALAFPDDNCTDAFTNDLAIFPLWEGEQLLGYNFALGGGLGTTHNKPETYARLATPIAFIPENELLRGVEAVVKLTRDYGDRTNRKHARLKYVVQEKGAEWIYTELQNYFGAPLQRARTIEKYAVEDHMGWHAQGDGKWFIGLPISSGRIIDHGNARIRSGLKAIITKFQPTLHVTADQNLLLGNLDEAQKPEIERMLTEFGIVRVDAISPVSRHFLACVALPTCGLALAEAERVQIPLTETLEQSLAANELTGEKISMRVSGCPNACSRPFAAEIALVGRMPGHYSFYLGGNLQGTALTEKIFDRVPYTDLRALFDALFAHFKYTRQEKEELGAFSARMGVPAIHAVLKERLGEKYKWAA